MLDSSPAIQTAPPRLVRLSDIGLSTVHVRMLSSLTLDLAAGAPTVVIGPNGAGKTSLLRLLMGLSAPTEGRIEERAADENGAGLRKAFVFQRPVMLRRTVADNLAYALKAAGLPASPEAIGQALERVGLKSLADRPARRLSGGEQQRLALARALSSKPALLLLDEPTASLDPHATKAIEDILTGVAASGTKIVMSTHDLGQARRLAGDIVFLAGGRLIEHTDARDFFSRPRTEAARRFLAGDIVLAH